MTNRALNIGRYRQIISVFSKNGFGLLIDQLGIFKYLKLNKQISDLETETGRSRLSIGERLRLSLEELGPTFIKLGQILSTRPDIFPADVIDELRKLQDSVPPFPFSEAQAVIESELEERIENIYLEFDPNPVAAASLAQVHRARLCSGKLVAVKVQRPGIEQTIELDISILRDLANFLDHHTPYGKLYNFTLMVQDFEKTIKEELDFTQEGENAERFRQNFIRDKGIEVPIVKWIYTTRRVLTMEFIEGIRIDDCPALEAAGINQPNLARNLVTSICNQILRDGFFHADPHPGNIQVLLNGAIVFLDLGMVGHLDETRKSMISKFFIGVTTRDSRQVVKALTGLEKMPSQSNLKQFEKDVDLVIDKYLTKPWKEIKLPDLFRDMFNSAFTNKIKIPQEFAMLGKTFGTLQGLLEKLAPDMNTLEVVKPIAKRLLRESFTLEKIGSGLRKSIWNYRDLLVEFPNALLRFMTKMEDEDFAVQMEIKGIDKILKRFDRDLNRVSLSIVLLSVSMIITGIIVGSSLGASAGTEIYQLNLMVLRFGLGLAAIIILGLVYSLYRSRH
jgi:ubiquinone biosynthesis protein